MEMRYGPVSVNIKQQKDEMNPACFVCRIHVIKVWINGTDARFSLLRVLNRT